jgi:protein CpxP
MIKKLILSIVLLLTFAVGSSFAQDGKGDHKKLSPSERATKVTDKMKTNLSLTDSEYKSVYDIFYNHFTEMSSMKDRSDRSTDEFKSERKQKREALKKELSGVLTSEQLQKMEDNRKKHKEKRKGKGKNKNKNRSDSPEKR